LQTELTLKAKASLQSLHSFTEGPEQDLQVWSHAAQVRGEEPLSKKPSLHEQGPGTTDTSALGSLQLVQRTSSLQDKQFELHGSQRRLTSL
jgi:hypothetical protein